MTIHNDTFENEVLAEMMMHEDFPSAVVIEDFVRRFPELAGEIMDFAAMFTLDDLMPDVSGPESIRQATADNAVEHAFQRFQTKLRTMH